MSVKLLMEKPGYFKWSTKKIAAQFGISEASVIKARQIFKNSKSIPITNVKVATKTSNNKVVTKSIQKISTKFDKNNVLIIADSHEPFCKEGYMQHCLDIQKEYKCGTVVHIGDEVDLCAISQWEKDPDGLSAGTESDLAQQKMKEWYKAFPTASVCIGNHLERPFRKARASGIPQKFLKTYEEAWQAPKGWKWADSWEFNGVLYTHGTGMSGASAAITLATRYRQSCVIGHIHTQSGIQYNASSKDLVWGMQVGGAIDDNKYAFAYAKHQVKKSIIGCGVVLNGKLPLYIPMKLS